MKPSEKEVLDTLRKTTLAYLSESDYAEIEKAVEQEGILNLTGTASAIVKSAVQKHGGGSHDQASHGSWAGNGAGGGNDPGGYKAEAKRDDAKDEANSRDAKTKEQVLSSNRSDKKVSEIATRLSALSDKMRTKTSNPYTKDDNIKAADKVKAISEKLTEAASADTSSFRHFELTQQAYDSIDKLSSAIFSNAGAGASFDSITMQASNYLGKLDDDLYYMNKAGVQKHGGGSHDQESHGSWAGGAMGGSASGTGAPKKISQDDMDGSSKEGSVATTPRILDKLFGKGEKVEGDEYERKVTEAWTFEMKNQSTGESFKAQVYDWMRYDDMGLTSEQGQKLAPMGRYENGTFSIATSSKSNADAVKDYIASYGE